MRIPKEFITLVQNELPKGQIFPEGAIDYRIPLKFFTEEKSLSADKTTAKIRKLLADENFNIRTYGQGNWTVLAAAIHNDSLEGVKLILDRDPTLLNEAFHDRSIPYLSYAMRNEEIFFEFIRRGASPHMTAVGLFRPGNGPLNLAIEAKASRTHFVRTLFTSPISPNITNYLFDNGVRWFEPDNGATADYKSVKIVQAFKELHSTWMATVEPAIRFLGGNLGKPIKDVTPSPLLKLPYDVQLKVASFVTRYPFEKSEKTQTTRVVVQSELSSGAQLKFCYTDEVGKLYPTTQSKDGYIALLHGDKDRSFHFVRVTADGGRHTEAAIERTIGDAKAETAPTFEEGGGEG